MGHPSDWDDVRAALPEYETSALEIGLAPNWQSSVQQMAEAIPSQSILVGYSMGARLALGVALESPENVAALIFVSGNPGLETSVARAERRDADDRIAKQIEEGSIQSFLQQWYQSNVFATLPDEIRSSEIERKLARSSTNWPAIMRTNSVSQQPNYWPRLKELAMPTLVVAGDLDEKYRKIAHRMEQECSLCDFSAKVIPDCGHIVHREQPLALVETIREFVDGFVDGANNSRALT